jgi:secondary thiamine-phosphate synthase enzyme
MTITADTLSFATRGNGDMKDITGLVQESLERAGLKDGIVVVFATGSTAAVTTIEYEPGLEADFSRLMERLAPAGASYEHDKRWGDGNGFSHVRASLVGPSLTVPFSGGRLRLGTWQQIVCVDFDNRSRTRTVALQFIGE